MDFVIFVIFVAAAVGRFTTARVFSTIGKESDPAVKVRPGIAGGEIASAAATALTVIS